MENDADFDTNPNSKLQLVMLKLLSDLEDKLEAAQDIMVKLAEMAGGDRQLEDRLGPIAELEMAVDEGLTSLNVEGGVVYRLEEDLEEEDHDELEAYFRARRTSTT